MAQIRKALACTSCTVCSARSEAIRSSLKEYNLNSPLAAMSTSTKAHRIIKGPVQSLAKTQNLQSKMGVCVQWMKTSYFSVQNQTREKTRHTSHLQRSFMKDCVICVCWAEMCVKCCVFVCVLSHFLSYSFMQMRL